jgi:hypothetical protein
MTKSSFHLHCAFSRYCSESSGIKFSIFTSFEREMRNDLDGSEKAVVNEDVI